MTDDLRTRIAAVANTHTAMGFDSDYGPNDSWVCNCGLTWQAGGTHGDHMADAVIRELPELPVKISTKDQLDALPFLTVIREVRPLRKGIDYGGIYERRTSGWQCIAGTWVEPERNGPPMLPVMVLWRGKDEQ